MEDYKFLFKVVLVGNAGVGKTCLVRRFTQGLFPPGQGATIGVDFLIKTIEIAGEKVKIAIKKFWFFKLSHTTDCRFKLQIWDTAGQERFRSITQSYYRSAHALVLVYDICTPSTFSSLPMWIKEIEQYANPKVLRALVGNKVDREERAVSSYDGEEFARLNNMFFIETSAKEADNVEKLFTEIASKLTRDAKSSSQKYNGRSHMDSMSVYLDSVESPEQNCCKFF